MKQDLLFSILAAQNGMIKPEDLIEIGSAWVANQKKGLKERLCERLSREDIELLEKLVTRSLAKCGGDVDRSIQALHADDLLFKTLGGAIVVDVEPGKKEPCAAPVFCEKVTIESPDRYSMKVEVKRGGIGRIFVALDEHIGRNIAIKELLCEATDEGTVEEKFSTQASKSLRARFLREARVTGQLEHPAIVPVYEIGQRLDGACYYTMRYVKGSTLLDAIRKRTELSERLKLLPHFHDLCNAVAYAHSKGVVNRDIKSENVMIGEFGETVVLDWGLAKVKGQEDIGAERIEEGIQLIKDSDVGKTTIGHAIGTPAYMPPEQAMGEIEKIDEKSDIYSLGAVLYEILTGQPPHTGYTVFEILAKVLNDDIIDPQKRDDRIPRELGAIARKALKKKKEERYPSALAIAADIESYMSGGRVGAYEYSSWELLMRFILRNKTISGLATLIFLLSIFAAVLISGYYREALVEKQRAEDNEREVHYQLSQFLTEKSQRAYQAKDLLSARMFAASALVHSPYNPYGTNRFTAPDQMRDEKALADLVEAHSALFQATAFGLATFAGVYLDQDYWTQSAVFSPDGRRLASGSSTGTIKLWDMSSKRLIASIANNGGVVYAVVFSPNGRYFVSAHEDKIIRFWDTDTRELIGSLAAHDDKVRAIAFSPDGRFLASGSDDGTVKVWDAATKKNVAVFAGHRDKVISIAFSPDGRMLASGSFDKTIRLWDVATKKNIAVLTGHDDWVPGIAFSPDGRILASVSNDRTVKLWDVGEKALLTTFTGHEEVVLALAFSPDGSLLASAGGDRTIRLWSMTGKNLAMTFTAHNDTIGALAFSPDGRSLVSAGYDRTLKLWDISENKNIVTLKGHGRSVSSLAYSSDGRFLATAAYDDTIRLWDLAENRQIAVLAGNGDKINAIAFSQKGDLLASGGWDKKARIWDVGTRELLWISPAHADTVWSVAFSPDGKMLATGSADKTIKLWDLTGERKLLPALSGSGHGGVVFKVVFSADGRHLASASWDNTAKLWDVGSKQLVRTLEGHTDILGGISFSPDDRLIASSSKDNTIKLWRSDTGELIRTIEGHKAMINHVEFSSDGRFLLSTGDDRTARIWEVESGTGLQTIGLPEMGLWASFSRDGKHFAVNSGNDVLIIPIDLDYWKRDPHELLKEAEKAAGMKLDGFTLHPMTPADFEAYRQ